jgi:hypothetical protein
VGMRRIGSAERARKRAKARARNRPRKVRERATRDARMLTVIQSRPLPYTPWVMSWLSTRLDKPSKAITQADVETILAAAHVHEAA